MRISEMLGQYNKNITSNSSDELQSAQSSGKMVSTFGELETGTIFEGTVSNIKNRQSDAFTKQWTDNLCPTG